MKRKKLAVIIGRFQSHRLHLGYTNLLKKALEFESVLILIGTSPRKATKENPLLPSMITRTLNKAIPPYAKEQVSYASIKNNRDDADWSKNVDTLIESQLAFNNLEEVVFIIGRDSFLPYYSGKFEEHLLVDIGDDYSSSKVRAEVKNNPLHDSEIFNLGAIWATQNQHPRIDPTVDIAVTKKVGDDTLLLLGKKPSESFWRLPGGYVDKDDESFEEAAVRELKEETGLVTAETSLTYISNHKIKDWRYRGSVDSVHTTLFHYDLGDSPQKAVAGDDLETLRWIKIKKGVVDVTDIVSEHIVLLADLAKYL